MTLGVYEIINDPIPQLFKIRDIQVNKNDFFEDDNIVRVLNKKLMVDKLSTEHFYALSLTYSCIPRGIIQVSVGKCDECVVSRRDLAIGLLLTGGEQFMVFHNHPGGCKNISKSDIQLTKECDEIGKLIEIKFLRHIMITQDYYTYCNYEEKMPFA